MHVRGTLLLLAYLIAAPVALAQNAAPKPAPGPAPAQAGDASGSAQSVERYYRFEVASVRPSDPPGLYKAAPPAYTPGHYRIERVSLGYLIGQALNVKHNYEVKTPSWVGLAYFTVNATLPEGATKADLPIMLQHLLEDRFDLKYHHETLQLKGYELVVAKSGSKLTKSVVPPPDSTGNEPMEGIEIDKNGNPHFGKDARSRQLGRDSTAWWHGRNETMQKLTSDISTKLQTPVKDATGLEGGYDFTMTFTQESSPGGNAVSPLPPPPTSSTPVDGAETSAPMEHPLLRDALREQLGLELRPVKDVPVDVLVVDSANKEPTEN